MENPLEIRVSRETVNDDTVTVAEWHFASGDHVPENAIVATLDTSKVALEVEAERAGYLEVLVEAGEEVAVGALIAYLHAQAREGVSLPVSGDAPPARDPVRPEPRFSKKARALLEGAGLAPELFESRALVREADVRCYLEAGTTKPGRQPAETVPAEHTPARKPEQAAGKAGPVHGFFADARRSAKTRGRSLVWLGMNYFFRNYLLGHMARMAPLGLNLLVHRLRGVRIGKGVYIDPAATIETAYPESVTIGNDVRVTAHAVIMTHIKAPHLLRDSGNMPLVRKPVVLEDHCFIGVNAVIMPGVTVGEGAVVASGAVVMANVSPHTLVAGNPARFVRKFSVPGAGANSPETQASCNLPQHP